MRFCIHCRTILIIFVHIFVQLFFGYSPTISSQFLLRSSLFLSKTKVSLIPRENLVKTRKNSNHVFRFSSTFTKHFIPQSIDLKAHISLIHYFYQSPLRTSQIETQSCWKEKNYESCQVFYTFSWRLTFFVSFNKTFHMSIGRFWCNAHFFA